MKRALSITRVNSHEGDEILPLDHDPVFANLQLTLPGRKHKVSQKEETFWSETY